MSESKRGTGLGKNNNNYRRDLLYNGKFFSAQEIAPMIGRSLESVYQSKSRLKHNKISYLLSVYGIRYVGK